MTRRTNVSIEFEELIDSAIPLQLSTMIIQLICALIVAWYLGWVDIVRRSMLVYAIICFCSYGFFIGGGWFSIIRNTPWVHEERGQIQYVSNMSRYQYTLEGMSFVQHIVLIQHAITFVT